MKRLAFWWLLLALAPSSWGLTLWGVDINGLEVQSSYFMVLNAVQDGAPDPIVNTLGASIPFRFLGGWTFRPEAQVFVLNYKYADGRAVPESSLFENVAILSLLVNPTVGYEFPLGPSLSWGAEGGLAFVSRFPIFFNGKTAGDMALPVTGWLMAGRLFYPSVASGITWQFSPLLAATLRGQLFYPIFNLWNNLPWYDQLTFGGGFGVRFTF